MCEFYARFEHERERKMEKEESKRIEIEDGEKDMRAYHREGERRGSDEQRELDGRTRKIDRRGGNE